MARGFGGFGGGRNVGQVRSPLSYNVQKELTADPMQQAQQEMKAAQPMGPNVPKLKLPKPPRKPNQFFGE